MDGVVRQRELLVAKGWEGAAEEGRIRKNKVGEVASRQRRRVMCFPNA